MNTHWFDFLTIITTKYKRFPEKINRNCSHMYHNIINIITSYKEVDQSKRM